MRLFLVTITAFVLLYLEPVTIGSLKISHLWKIVFIGFVIVSIILIQILARDNPEFEKGVTRVRTLKAGYLLAFMTLLLGGIHLELLVGLGTALQRIFPIIILHFLLLRNYALNYSKKYIRLILFFVTLSSLPFVLNIIEPLGQRYDVISLLGAQKNGFVGVFQNQHSASLALVLCALLATCFFLAHENGKKRLGYALVAGYLVGLCFLTYVRTGVVAYLVGLIVYLFSRGTIGRFFKVALVLGGSLVIFLLFVAETDVFKDRLLGRTSFSRTSTLDFNRISSGRLDIWQAAGKIFMDNDLLEELTGLGIERFENKISTRVDMKVFAHNGFINEMLVNGLIGLIFYLYFYWALYYDLRSIEEKEQRSRALALYFSWVTFAFFQGGEFPVHFIPLVIFVSCASSISATSLRPTEEGCT